MTAATLSPAALTTLWEGVGPLLERRRAQERQWEADEALRLAGKPRPSPRPRDRQPPTREAAASLMGGYLAWAWTNHHPAPADLRALQQDLADAGPQWCDRLETLWDTAQALERMADANFRWIPIEEALPDPGQPVLYFFDIVGTHPGRYQGMGEDECEGLTVFVGDFGGFLGGDVTHWMPRPGVAWTPPSATDAARAAAVT